MKICIVGDQFSNIFRGGAEVQLENTASYLQKTGEIEIIYLSRETRSLSDVDLVHFFTSKPEFAPFAANLKEKNIPYVVSTVMLPKPKIELFLYRCLNFLPKKVRNHWIAPAMRLDFWKNAAKLFPNTDEEAKFVALAAKTPAEQITIIPNGLDLAEMPENNPELCYNSFPQLKNQKFVLNVARIEKRKNQKNLILACRDLDFPVVLVGNVWEEDYFKEILELKYEKLHYLGAIFDRNLLFSIFSACNLFCLPSIVETPGIAALEAAFYDKPIVITKNGGTKYYFGENACYVDWKNVKEIRNGIEIMSAKKVSTKKLISEYSWDKIAEKYVAIYKQILEKTKTS